MHVVSCNPHLDSFHPLFFIRYAVLVISFTPNKSLTFHHPRTRIPTARSFAPGAIHVGLAAAVILLGEAGRFS